MSNLSQQKTKSTVMVKNTGVSFNSASKHKARVRKAKPAIQKVHSLPPVREKKILEIRQQLADGTYDIDRRLGVALDYFLEGMIG